MIKKKEPWYIDSFGPEKELRKLLSKLLQQCFNMKSGSGIVLDGKWEPLINKRPFVNAFNKTKKNNNVFTKKIVADFLFLAVREDKIDVAVKVLKESEYGNALEMIEYDNGKIEKCKNIESDRLVDSAYGKCIENIIDNNPFDECCADCPIKWIYTNLKFIENNYWNIVSEDKDMMPYYSSGEQESLVEEIFSDINSFEEGYNENTVDEGKVCELFNSCIRCLEIPDVIDEKLGYVKWYTSHLCNWPFFKSCLLELEYYNENTTYKLLCSASRILKSSKSEDEKLMAEIESEKIVSYISLAYQNPFAMEYCEKYDEIVTNCKRIIALSKRNETRIAIYIELWNLSFHAHKNLDIDENEEIIKNILEDCNLKNTAIDELKSKYYIYQYMYNRQFRKSTEKKLSNIGLYFRHEEICSDTLDVASELFINIDENNPNVKSECDNPYITIKSVKGFGVEEKMIKNPPNRPSRYKRIFGDDSLVGFLKRYRN